MFRFFALFFYLNLSFAFCDSHEKVICDDSKDIILNENDIVFIESPGYPAPVTDEMVHNCNLNIYGNPKTEDDSMFLVIVLAIGSTQNNFMVNDTEASHMHPFYLQEGSPKYYKTNSSSVVFSYSNPIVASDNYVAFQGYIYYEKADNCEMTRLSHPLFLADESEVIYIYAPKSLDSNVTCSWTFTAPKEYGFKFTSLLSDDDGNIGEDITDVLIIVKNSSDYIITDIYTKSNLPYYNVDHNITVILQTTSTTPFFNALISVVLKDPVRVFANCEIENHDGYISWYSNIYPNNAACNYSTTITSSQQLFLRLSRTIDIFEAFADILTFQNDNDEDSITHVIDVDENNDLIVNVFGAYENGTTKTIHWTFLSDGSITTQNFDMDFILYDCACNNNTVVVPCDGEYDFTLIDTSYIVNVQYMNWYCANINCSFTITIDENCPDKYVIADFSLNSNGNSLYRLISDGQTTAESCITKECNTNQNKLAIIKPYSNTTLEFFSGPLLENAAFELSLQAYDSMNFETVNYKKCPFEFSEFKVLPPIIITHEIPWQSLNSYFVNHKSLFVVELSDVLKRRNDSIMINLQDDVFSDYIMYYNDLSLTIAITADDINSMNIKSFVVYVNKEPGELAHYIAKAKKASAEGCRFPNTVFPLNPLNINDFNYTNALLRNSMLSNENETCTILITRSLYTMVLKHVFTYQKGNRKNIEIYNGLNKQTEILSFNEDSALGWQYLVLGSYYYVVKIPPFTSFYFEAFDYSYYFSAINISSPCLSLVETQLYGTLESYNGDDLTYNIQNITVRFTVRDYDISKEGTLSFVDGSGNTKLLTYVNQIVEYSSTTVSLHYVEPNDGYKGARIYLTAFYKELSPRSDKTNLNV